MSYTSPDLQTDLRRHLERAGYTFTGTDDQFTPGCIADDDWQWRHGDDVGELMSCETAAEADATEHFFERASAIQQAAAELLKLHSQGERDLDAAMAKLNAAMTGQSEPPSDAPNETPRQRAS